MKTRLINSVVCGNYKFCASNQRFPTELIVMTKTRVADSRAASGIRNTYKAPHEQPENNPRGDETPNGHVHTMDEQEDPNQQEDEVCQGDGDSYEEDDRKSKRGEPRAALPNLDEAAKIFIKTNEAAKLFLQFMEQRQGRHWQGEEEVEASSKHGAPRQHEAPNVQIMNQPSRNNPRGNPQADRVRDNRNGFGHRDRN